MLKLTTLVFCFLFVGFSAPTHSSAAVQDGNEQDTQTITQDPTVAKLVITGPNKVSPGNLVVISVEGSDAKSFKWLILPSTNNYLVIEDGRRVVFSSGTGGTYTFIVACSLGDTCDLGIHTVTVTGESDKPVDSLTSKIALWCNDVQTDEKRDECLALAQSFASVASEMEGGTLTTPLEIVRATFKSNKEALGDSLDNWIPFRDGLSTQLKKMAASKELTDVASHIRVWKAIAIGLREYASTL